MESITKPTGYSINEDGDGPDTVLSDSSIIRSGSIIYKNVEAGSNLHVGHNVLIRDNCRFGENVSIGSGTIVEHSVQIADNCRLHSACFIPEYTQIMRNSWIGPRVTITNSRYPNKADSTQNLEPVIIEENCVIGANVTILPGVRIGANSLVGAASLVAKSIPPNSIAYGHPASVKGKI